MAYFKINNNDYSMYVNTFVVTKKPMYKSAVNAAGNTVVKYQTTKRTFTVGIVPLDAESMAALQKDLSAFQVTITYRDPETNALITGVNCIIPVNEVQYYTIQADKVMYKAFLVTIQEL